MLRNGGHSMHTIHKPFELFFMVMALLSSPSQPQMSRPVAAGSLIKTSHDWDIPFSSCFCREANMGLLPIRYAFGCAQPELGRAARHLLLCGRPNREKHMCCDYQRESIPSTLLYQ